MKKKYLFIIPSVLFFIGCDQDSNESRSFLTYNSERNHIITSAASKVPDSNSIILTASFDSDADNTFTISSRNLIEDFLPLVKNPTSKKIKGTYNIEILCYYTNQVSNYYDFILECKDNLESNSSLATHYIKADTKLSAVWKTESELEFDYIGNFASLDPNFLSDSEDSNNSISSESNSTSSSTSSDGNNSNTQNSSYDNNRSKSINYSTLFGGVLNDKGSAIDIDENGYIYIAGERENENNNTNRNDVFLAKYNENDKTFDWLVYSGSKKDDFISDIKVKDGYIFTAGYTFGDYASSNAGNADIIVSKYNSADGSQIWSKQLGNSEANYALSLELNSDTIFIVGGSNGHFNELDENASLQFIGYVLKMDTNGSILSTDYYGSNSQSYIQSISIKDNNILISGGTTASIFGNIYNGTDESVDIFIANIKDDGYILWSKEYGGTGNDTPSSITVDSQENIYIGGWTSSDFYGATFKKETDAFVIKLTSTGDYLWSTTISSNTEDNIVDLAINSQDELLAIGNSKAKIDNTSFYGRNDFFIAIFNSDGNESNITQYGSNGNDYLTASKIDTSGNLYSVGSSDSTLFNNSNNGKYDALLLKFDTLLKK